MPRKSTPIVLGLEECARAALELAEQAYKFAPSAYTHAVVAATRNVVRFLPPITNEEASANE
jgi:hypothetical protein